MNRVTTTQTTLRTLRRPPLAVHVRWMIARDVRAVVAIDRASFADPWGVADVLACLRARGCLCAVAESAGGLVAGFVVYDLHPDRLDVLRFAVAPAFQRNGVGGQMVSRLIAKLAPGRRTRLLIDVPETHLSAQRFFRRWGFLATGVLRSRHPEGRDDYRFEYELPTTGEVLP